MVTVTLAESGVPKRNFVEGAFEEWGAGGFTFDRTPEECNRALRRLNAMMQEWPFSELCYICPDYGVGVLDDLSGVPRKYEQVVTLALAQRIAPTDGAQLLADSKATLARAMQILTSSVASIPTARMERTAMGAGNRGLTFWGSDCDENPVVACRSEVIEGSCDTDCP